MQFFRLDPYKTYRGVWFLLGFWGIIEPFFYLTRRESADSGTALILSLFILGFVIALVANHRKAYMAIDGEDLLVSKILGKVHVPVAQIRALSYEARFNMLVLTILYDQAGTSKRQGFTVDFMSTKTLNAFNESVRDLKPAIEIVRDGRSERHQERNVDLHLKFPTKFRGKVIFAVRWLLVGAAVMSALLSLLAPAN